MFPVELIVCVWQWVWSWFRPAPPRPLLAAADAVELARHHGFTLHEHVVRTQDNYLLTVHRLVGSGPVVYFHHGLCTNLELFLLGTSPERCLPLVLARRGYDVWLGNNRGNKYSRKHTTRSPDSHRFWDFSLDEFALYDIPDTVAYILGATGQPLLTYVGFSQGSAQALAALLLLPKLNQQINAFVGLLPAMVPRELAHPVLRWFVLLAPQLLFTIFGPRAILPLVVFWQRVMGPDLYIRVVDALVGWLFGWNTTNISPGQKRVGYQHMFLPTSTKLVAHWFQIIRNKRFQMYDDGGAGGSVFAGWAGSGRAHRVAPFPVHNITTPLLLVYGDSDSLVDMERNLQVLQNSKVETLSIAGYEHMDTLWGHDVEALVFAPVVRHIEQTRAMRC